MSARRDEQLLRSLFFHQKLHEWRMVEIFDDLCNISGRAAKWDWDLADLGIDVDAWNKVIHRGIKPVLVFAHPQVLQQVPGAVAYYRMLAIVSQKSMQQMGRSEDTFSVGRHIISLEEGRRDPGPQEAQKLARWFNYIISPLINSHAILREEELWLWRGMSAGSQADGSWRNRKGKEAENILWTWLSHVLRLQGWKPRDHSSWQKNEMIVERAPEPDIQVRRHNEMVAAVEVKGGKDPAGVLERIGAAVKTLQRIKDEHPAAATVLVLRRDAVTEAARQEWHRLRSSINAVFFLEDLTATMQPVSKVQQDFLRLLRLL